MTLIERRVGQEDMAYQDSEWLSRYQWEKMLGIANSTIESAVTKSGAKRKDGPPPHRFESVRRLICVDDFPRIIRALGRSRRRGGYPGVYSSPLYHPWADVVTSRDFEVTTPTGATLIYRYEKK